MTDDYSAQNEPIRPPSDRSNPLLSLYHMSHDVVHAMADDGDAAPPISDEMWDASQRDQQRSLAFWFEAATERATRAWRHITGRQPTRWELWVLQQCVMHNGEAYTSRAIWVEASRAGFTWPELDSERPDGRMSVEIKATEVWRLLERWSFEANCGIEEG